MQIDTGCKINVSPATGQDIERDIGLVGSRDSIERAKHAIMEKVHAVVSFVSHLSTLPYLPVNQQQEKNNRTGGAGAGAGGGRRGEDRQFNSVSYPHSQTPTQRPYGGQQNAPAADDKGDPYAAYGGYEAYAMLWYNYQQAQQNPQSQGPPGS